MPSIPAGYRVLDPSEIVTEDCYLCPKGKSDFKRFKSGSKALGIKYSETKRKNILFPETVVITNKIRLAPISIKGKIKINLNKH